MRLHDDDSRLGPLMLWFETHQVDDTHRLALLVFNDEPYLSVCKDVITRRGDIVVQRIAAVGHIRCSDVPQSGVVLNLVEQIEVFWFNGT